MHSLRRVASSTSHLATALLCAFVLSNALLAQKPGTDTATAKASKPTEIVFVGNSYTFFNDLPAMVAALGAAETPPRQITTRMLAPGGFSLQQHWAATGDDAPRTVLGNSKPDFVVLQEQSRMPIDNQAQMQSHAAKFAKLIKQRKSTAVWYMTWARLAEPEAQAAITDGYAKVHQECGGLLAPVGNAWKAVRDMHPEQKLHTEDGSHPNPSGTYLAACVLHATMFGSDIATFPDKLVRKGADGKDTVLIELGAEQGKRLRDAAAQVLTATAKKKR